MIHIATAISATTARMITSNTEKKCTLIGFISVVFVTAAFTSFFDVDDALLLIDAVVFTLEGATASAVATIPLPVFFSVTRVVLFVCV